MSKNSSNMKKKRKSKSVPKKPYDGFALTPRKDGRWCKRVAGKLHYLGRIKDDPDGSAALERLNREFPYLVRGDIPPDIDVDEGGCTIRTLCNSFLNTKHQMLQNGEIADQTFLDYQRTTDTVVRYFGKNRKIESLIPRDFELVRIKLAKGVGLTSLGKAISGIRSIFKYASDQQLIERPVNFGQSFNKPKSKAIKRSKRDGGKNMFSADEIRLMLDAAEPVLKAMIMLGTNCGFGNNDCSSLPKSAIDFENGWIEFPRPKTDADRRIPLWPETIEALREAIKRRPRPKDKKDDGLVFITRFGRRWVRVTEKKNKKDDEQGKLVATNSVTGQMRKLLRDLKINHRRRLNFYSLRHTFRTIADNCKDQPSIDSIMGHADGSMASAYREGISDERLIAVTTTVRNWLWPEKVPAPKRVDTISPTSLGNQAIVVVVEYDIPAGKRKSKKFDDQFAARRFYVAKEVEGRNPSVSAEGGVT